MNWTKIFYQLRNWKAWFRALWYGMVNGDGMVSYTGELRAIIRKADGSIVDLGVLSRRVVTTAGVNYMRDDFNAATGSADITNFNYHACGTGTNAEAIGDTALQTDSGVARVAGTQSGPASKQYRSVATMSFTSTLAITEHGLFSASSSGTLWDRSVFSAINVVSGDSIQFTYTLTINDGG